MLSLFHRMQFFNGGCYTDRLVDSVSIRKGIEAVYGSYLPKNSHPFVYMR